MNKKYFEFEKIYSQLRKDMFDYIETSILEMPNKVLDLIATRNEFYEIEDCPDTLITKIFIENDTVYYIYKGYMDDERWVFENVSADVLLYVVSIIENGKNGK
jgi:hypothetical protein